MSNSQYSKLPGIDTQQNFEGSDAPPQYPPAQSGGSHLTTAYVFMPRWPVPGSSEYATGRLCANREETLALVREAFPILENYPDCRIEFFTVHGGMHWSKLLSSTFERIMEMKPSKIKVQVADAPGDASKRSMRTAAIVLGCFLLSFLFIAFIAHLVR